MGHSQNHEDYLSTQNVLFKKMYYFFR